MHRRTKVRTPALARVPQSPPAPVWISLLLPQAYPWGPSDCAMFDLQCRSGKADHDDHAEHH